MKLSLPLLAAILLGVVAAAPLSEDVGHGCTSDDFDIPAGASGIDGDVPATAVEAMKKRCTGANF